MTINRGSIPDWMRRIMSEHNLLQQRWVDHHGTIVVEDRHLFVSEPYSFDAKSLSHFLEFTQCTAQISAPGLWHHGTMQIQVSPPPHEDDNRYFCQPVDAEPSDNSITIYGLSDPRDRLYHYVGMTTDLEQRTKSHQRWNYHDNEEKGRWVADLQKAGLKFGVDILERTSWSRGRERERAWILKLRHEGHPLLSREYGSKVNATPAEWQAIADGLSTARSVVSQVCSLVCSTVGGNHAAYQSLSTSRKKIDAARCRLDSTLYRLTGNDGVFYGHDLDG